MDVDMKQLNVTNKDKCKGCLQYAFLCLTQNVASGLPRKVVQSVSTRRLPKEIWELTSLEVLRKLEGTANEVSATEATYFLVLCEVYQEFVQAFSHHDGFVRCKCTRF